MKKKDNVKSMASNKYYKAISDLKAVLITPMVSKLYYLRQLVLLQFNCILNLTSKSNFIELFLSRLKTAKDLWYCSLSDKECAFLLCCIKIFHCTAINFSYTYGRHTRNQFVSAWLLFIYLQIKTNNENPCWGHRIHKPKQACFWNRKSVYWRNLKHVINV